MAEPIEIKELEERVILIGISTGEGDDAEASLKELEELADTAGAVLRISFQIQDNRSGNI